MSDAQEPGYRSAIEHLGEELARLSAMVARRSEDEQANEDPGPDPRALREQIDQRIERARSSGVELPLERLKAIFDLSPLEMDILLLVAAPALEPWFAAAYADLAGDPAKRFATAELLMRVLSEEGGANPPAVTVALRPQGDLFHWQLVQVDGDYDPKSGSLYARPLFADTRIISLIAAAPSYDPPLPFDPVPIAPRSEPSAIDADLRAALAHLRQRLAAQGQKKKLICFYGPDEEEMIEAAARLAAGLKIQILAVDAERLLEGIAQGDQVFRDRALALLRDSFLCRAALLIRGTDILLDRNIGSELPPKKIISLLVEHTDVLWLTATSDELRGAVHRWLRRDDVEWIELKFPRPSHLERQQAWETALDASPVAVHLDRQQRSSLAARYRVSAGQIRRAVALAGDIARARPRGPAEIRDDDLRTAVRSRQKHALSTLAARVESGASFEDLILPERSHAQLRELAARRARQHVVLEDWGFRSKLRYGGNIVALFSGPPGTGKTMAASIVARELDQELFRIDLSAVMSKWIGETEKNIAKIFESAAAADVMLLFDEADALFAKRTEVKASHDRYANTETGYLLQRIEQHEGVIILATNLRENIDEAFTRRMGFVIDFPFPDPSYRRRIWATLFPAGAPLEPDVDFEFLAERLVLSGGGLRNVALAAAFLAADRGERIGMRHLLLAGHREYGKLGKPFIAADFEPYSSLLESPSNAG